MSWKVRREGETEFKVVDGPAQVLEGVRDGLWEPTDHVLGPDDKQWQPMEDHVALADTVAELTEPPPQPHRDETHLDMNPLIDVALVLLVFFMLTTAYTAIHRVIDLPPPPDESHDPVHMNLQDIKDKMIMVSAKSVNGQPKITVDDRDVTEDALMAELSGLVKSKKKTEMFLDAAKGVKYGLFVAILDAAKGAGVTKIHVPGANKAKPPPKAGGAPP